MLEGLSPHFALSSPLLRTLATAFDELAATPVHAVYLPISALTLVHAARVSYATRQVQGGTGPGSKRPLLQSMFLGQILLFGGVTVAALLLSTPSPLLFAPGTIALYSSVHALLTLSGAGDALLQIGSAPGTGMAMDLGIAAIDGICRSEGIALLGVQAVRNHYNPVIASSPFAMILAGTLVGGGAPLLISTFDLGSAQWQLGTPGWLTQPFGLLAIDIWSAALLSALYAGLTSPAGFKSLTGSLPSVFRAHFTTHVGPHLKIATDAAERLLMLRSADSSGIAEKIANAASASASAIAGRPLLSASEARVVCGLLLFAIFALNRVGRPLLGSILGGNRNGLKGAGKTKIGGGPQTPTSASSTKASGRARIQNGSPSSAASPSPALRRSSRKTQ